MLKVSVFRRASHVGRVLHFSFRGKVRPEKRYAISSIGSGESLLKALFVVDIGGNNLGATAAQSFCLFAVDVSGDGARGEAAGRIVQDGLNQPTALRTGRTHNRYDFLFSHIDLREKFSSYADALVTPSSLRTI